VGGVDHNGRRKSEKAVSIGTTSASTRRHAISAPLLATALLFRAAVAAATKREALVRKASTFLVFTRVSGIDGNVE